MKAQVLSDVDEEVPENSTDYTEIYSYFDNMEPMDFKPKSYAMPFVAGKIYNIWWLTGIDFTHLAIEFSQYYEDTDPAIIFKFNYT